MDLENILETLIDFASVYGIKIIGAIVIWIIGSWIIKKIMTGVKKVMSKRDYDESLQKFLLNLINWMLKILLVIAILGKLGVETTSFAAIIAAAGLAIGMALQGSLANFAGGVLIMIFKPIKIGDLIKAQGEIGVVKEIEIFTTKLTSPDNKLVIIPNGTLSNGNITNYTAEGKLRVDLTFGVGYDADIKQTKEVSSVFNSAIKLLPEVVECNFVSGSFDYLIKILTPDMDSYHQFHQEKLSVITGVSLINSFFVMSEVKSTTELPI